MSAHVLRVPGRFYIKVDPDLGLYVTLKSVQGRPLTTRTVCESPLVNLDFDGEQLVGIEVLR